MNGHETTTGVPVEVLTSASAARAKVALFDFDGTLSLTRAGWIDVMVPLMVEALAELRTRESEAELTVVVRTFVDRLTGKQAVYQMIELSRQLHLAAGRRKTPSCMRSATSICSIPTLPTAWRNCGRTGPRQASTSFPGR